ncbi:hypothetical protein MMC11_005011 [Xylographa trunciseda]|nr:hypothetical protein [Xylographa trunciseda]
MNSPQASSEHYSSRERSERNNSGGSDLLSPYSIYSNDDVYGTPRSRSTSATSQSSNHVGSQWGSTASPFALADPSPFTEYPLYSPSYSVNSYGPSLGTSSMSDYTQSQSSAIPYVDNSAYDSSQAYVPNTQFYGNSSQRYPGAGPMDMMTADPYSRSSSMHRGVSSGNNPMTPVYASGMPYNYGSQQPASHGYSGATMQTTYSKPYSGQSSAYSGGTSGTRHIASTSQSMSYAMGYEPSQARSPHTSGTYEIRPQRRR